MTTTDEERVRQIVREEISKMLFIANTDQPANAQAGPIPPVSISFSFDCQCAPGTESQCIIANCVRRKTVNH